MSRPEKRYDRVLDWLPFLSMAALAAGLIAVIFDDIWRIFTR